MSKKRRAALLDKYPRVEKPEAPEGAGGEELNVEVVHLNNRDQPVQIQRLLELIWPPYDDINSESEEVLTVRLTPNGEILSVAPPPGRHFPWLLGQSGEQAP